MLLIFPLILNCFLIIYPDNPEMMKLDEMTEKVFQEMDLNNDNKVTKDEFVQACLSNKNISGMLAKKMVKIISTDTM